ncbi:hypothetical protein [Winogradskyella helgolandensis]|uniref:hypothetical protein n=1 Tax=Winogradskyella helgolandensis TaxID=2697010 RepID=UPI0015CA6219|nr:hypothetical protein [Winogradskyella helgolandensis]
MKTKQLNELKKELETIITLLEQVVLPSDLKPIERKRASAQNLLHYIAIRKIDVSGLQKQLKKIGASRLARSEDHMLQSLYLLHRLVCGLLNVPDHLKKQKRITIARAEKKIE